MVYIKLYIERHNLQRPTQPEKKKLQQKNRFEERFSCIFFCEFIRSLIFFAGWLAFRVMAFVRRIQYSVVVFFPTQKSLEVANTP